MRTILRSLLSRLGVTGKLILHVGWIMAVSLVLLVYLAHVRAFATIRDELRATEAVRIQQWSARHEAAIRAGDAWKMAEAITELGKDPYVIFAGLYDKGGRPIARSGDEDAYLKAHTLDLLVGVQGGPAGGAEMARPGAAPPLPGLAPVPTKVERALPFKERFREAIEETGGRSESLLGWVEVTLTTAPLDVVASRGLRPLTVLAVLLFAVAMSLTWLLSRRLAVPLRLLMQNVDLIATGGLDVPFDEVPRPADEVGELATRISIMTGRMRREQEALQERIRGLEGEDRRS